MSDITASERRLSAALDRLDQLLEAGQKRGGGDPDALADLTRRLAEAEGRNADLERQLSEGQPAADMSQLSDLQARLETATEQSARLSAANEDLMAANRNLIDAEETGGVGEDERREALEAEIGALRAAREAEMAQMSEIMAELERLLAQDQAAVPAVADKGV
ncbi:hypothetical protein [Paracoccus rhizosphaerae]|uniref:Uncharacterized protein n=1 Tax=Paracoccus rhizosphaerae TaxID=1133347 RepID=A0ABV6CFB1_9RHOB|nr:hypothetical protein [Paracoccus rhizosphaerae]